MIQDGGEDVDDDVDVWLLRHGPWLPSPVPSDTDLWPGCLPFTAFGQWGQDQLDLRVFDQAVWWVDRVGAAHALDEMSPEYVNNVIAWLVEYAPGFWAGALWGACVDGVAALVLGRPSGDALAIAAGDTSPIHKLEPEEWLESTPLMRKLRRLHADHASRSQA